MSIRDACACVWVKAREGSEVGKKFKTMIHAERQNISVNGNVMKMAVKHLKKLRPARVKSYNLQGNCFVFSLFLDLFLDQHITGFQYLVTHQRLKNLLFLLQLIHLQ